jgi:hypothetical protein
MRNEEPVNAAQSLLERFRAFEVDPERDHPFGQSCCAGIARECYELDRVSGEQRRQGSANATGCTRDGDSRRFDIGARVVKHVSTFEMYHGTNDPAMLDQTFQFVKLCSE